MVRVGSFVEIQRSRYTEPEYDEFAWVTGTVTELLDGGREAYIEYRKEGGGYSEVSVPVSRLKVLR